MPQHAAALDAVLRERGLTAVFQPIVELDGRRPVAVEALCRGPEGHPLQRPDVLFAAAAAEGRTAEVDWAAREAAMRAAVAGGLAAPALLFLNVEPDGLGLAEPAALAPLRERLEAAGVRVVVEITERALTSRPAELLAAVAEVRRWGWTVAVDDVGAERESLALLPFLAPDVVKLDLRLVQQRTTVETAQIVNAVRAQVERTGALLLAEGLETEEQVALAQSMGAVLGQGWLFGRPTPDLERDYARLELPGCRPPSACTGAWANVSERLPVRRATKPLLVAMSKTIEQQALSTGEAAVVLGTFQHERHFTPATATRYSTLAASAAFVAALATGLDAEPAPGVRGTALAHDDDLTAEWDLAVVAPHFAAALVARDLGDAGADRDRRFDYCVTYDRDTVLGVAAGLMERVGAQPAPARAQVRREAPSLPAALEVPMADLLRRAVDASATGITVADARALDSPLIFVNPAFEQLSGYAAEQIVGRNCRFLQSEATDRDAVRMIREQLRAGRPVVATLVNQRPDGSQWWNELRVSPVHDATGRVTHFIGVQADVSARVEAERRLHHLATHDLLTGLLNRTAFYERLTHELRRSSRSGAATGVLYLDLDGFKAVNDEHGHASGDALLMRVADALKRSARPGDVVARLGGDEFAVVLPGLPASADEADLAMAGLARRVEVAVQDAAMGQWQLRTSIGGAVHPHDASDVDALVAAADRAMYADKTSRRTVLPVQR